jgi:hypothetical protein
MRQDRIDRAVHLWGSAKARERGSSKSAPRLGPDEVIDQQFHLEQSGYFAQRVRTIASHQRRIRRMLFQHRISAMLWMASTRYAVCRREALACRVEMRNSQVVFKRLWGP